MITVATRDRVDELIAAFAHEDIYFPVDEARQALRLGGSFNLIDLESQDKVDIYVAPPTDQFAVSRLARRVKNNIRGVDTWVTIAEDIILAKLRWRRESRSERQWQDCCDLAACNDLDVTYLRTWADHLGVREDLEDLLEQRRAAW